MNIHNIEISYDQLLSCIYHCEDNGYEDALLSYIILKEYNYKYKYSKDEGLINRFYSCLFGVNINNIDDLLNKYIKDNDYIDISHFVNNANFINKTYNKNNFKNTDISSDALLLCICDYANNEAFETNDVLLSYAILKLTNYNIDWSFLDVFESFTFDSKINYINNYTNYHLVELGYKSNEDYISKSEFNNIYLKNYQINKLKEKILSGVYLISVILFIYEGINYHNYIDNILVSIFICLPVIVNIYLSNKLINYILTKNIQIENLILFGIKASLIISLIIITIEFAIKFYVLN